MSQNRHLIAATALLLAGMLVSPLADAATVTQMHVHLQILSSCSIHIDPKTGQAPDVSCSHGKVAFAVSHEPAHAPLEPPASTVAASEGPTASAPKVWVVTF
jgi:hypothetical protein